MLWQRISRMVQNLKRVEVIEDDEDEIMEAVRRMSDRYDFIVTRYRQVSEGSRV